MDITFIIIGLGIGAVAGWFMARFKFTADRQADLSALLVTQEKNKSLSDQLEELKESLASERQKVIALNNSLAASEADYRNLEEKLSERKKEVDHLQERFTAEFKNLANDILEKNSAKFSDL